MIRLNTFRNIRSLYEISVRNKSEPALSIEELEKETTANIEVLDEEIKKREDELERKRNKSRLRDYHRNMVHHNNPFPEPRIWFHNTLSYNRKMYGRYGASSGVDPSYCWPTKQELSDKIEYEAIAYPYTIQEAADEAKQKRAEKEERIRVRQEDVVRKMAKLEQWKKDLKNKVIQKETEALVAKQRKERLIEDVRRHFGYTVDPREEKFQQMLEKKEKEQKKASKEERKKEKEARMISALLSKKTDDVEQGTEKEKTTKPADDTTEKPTKKKINKPVDDE